MKYDARSARDRRTRPQRAHLLAVALQLACAFAQSRAAAQQTPAGAATAPDMPATPEASGPADAVDVHPPVLETFVDATYPEQAEAAGIAADVPLALSLDAAGRVTDVQVVSPQGHGFDEAAREAALRFRFAPARRGEQAVSSRILYTYSFVPQPPSPPPPVVATAEPPAAPPATEAPMEVTVHRESAAEQLRHSSRAVTVLQTGAAQRESADLGTVLGRAEGVAVQRGGGLGSRARISLNGLSGEQVRVFLDGVPLELSGFTMGLANMPVDFVDRVEIYRGVVPSRLGADSLGGAINLVSDEDVYGTQLRASYLTGSFDTDRVTLSARTLHPPSGLFARVRAFLDHARNDYPVQVEQPDESGRPESLTVRRFHDGYDAYGVSGEVGAVDSAWAQRLLLRAFYTDMDREVQNNARMTVPYGEVLLQRHSAGTSLRYVHAPNARTHLEAILAYAFTETTYDDAAQCRYDWFGRCVFDLPQPGEVQPYPVEATIRQHAPLGRLQVAWRPRDDHALRLSLAPTYVSRTGDNRAVLEGQRDVLQALRQVFNGVAGVEYELGAFEGRLDNTAFIKGYLRVLAAEEELPSLSVQDVRETRGYFGGGDSLRFRFVDGVFAKTSYEYAVRLPTDTELFGNGANVIANFHLGPEVSQNLNLSLTAEDVEVGFGTIRAHLNGFARLVDNLIVLSGVDVFQYQNVQAARVLGVESTAGWSSPRDYLSVGGAFTFQDLRNTSDEEPDSRFRGERIPNRPYMFANAEATARWPEPFLSSDALSLTWRMHWVHPFDIGWASLATDDSLAIPTQLTHALVATYMIERDERALSASIEASNITDARVYDLYGVQRPGRAAYAKFALTL